MTEPISTALAVYAAAKTAKGVYDEIINFLTPAGPSAEDKILAKLEVLHQDFTALKGQIDQLLEEVKRAVSVEQQSAILELQHNLDTFRGQSRTAIDQLTSWIDGGRTDPALRANADNNSRLAVNSLLEGDSFYFRPDPNSPDPHFDYRLAVVAYSYTLVVRIGVIAALNPQYRANAVTRAELKRHADRLDWIVRKADQAIEPRVKGQVSGDSFHVWSTCFDHASGYESALRDSGWVTGGQAELDDSMSYRTADERAEMLLGLGVGKLMALRDTTAYLAKDPRVAGWSGWTAVNGLDQPVPWAGQLTAATSQPGRTTLVWGDTDKKQLRAAAYDPTANPPVWRPSVAISLENFARVGGGVVGDYEADQPVALAYGPGGIAVVFLSTNGELYATRTDVSQPSGWLAAPVKISGTDGSVSGFRVAAANGMVAACWLDYTNATIRVALQDANGAWSAPQALLPNGTLEAGNRGHTVVCPSPGVAMVFWVTSDNVIHGATYDARVANPAWSAPTQIAVATSISRYDVSLFGIGSGDGQADLFWEGADRAIWTVHYNGSWSAPAAITAPRTMSYGWAPPVYLAATAKGRVYVFWQGDDERVHSMYRDPQQTAWSAPREIGHPWALPNTVAVTALPGGEVALYRADIDDSTNQTIQSCFYDTGTPTPTAELAVANALLTQAQQLTNLPGPVRAEAADRAVDALAVTRAIAAENPTYRRQLAEWSTYPVPNYLTAANRFEEAESAGAESVSLYRALAQENPSDDELAFRVSWAQVVSGENLWGKPELRTKAAASTVSGIDGLRALVGRAPAYRSQLAEWAAWPTAAFLAATGDFDKAEALGTESISLYRALAQENPGSDELAFRVGWAEIVLAESLWGKPELRGKATDLAVRGTDDLRALARRAPAYRRQLAEWATWPTSSFLAATGDFDKAEALGAESVNLYRALAQENPDDHESAFRVAWAQIVSGENLWADPGRRAEATALVVRGTDDLRALAGRAPAYRRQLAEWAAWPASSFLAATGDFDKAEACGTESINLYRALAQENPADDELAFRISWAQIVLAEGLWAKPELHAKAAALAVSATDDLRPLTARAPSYRPRLAEWLVWPTVEFLVATGQQPRAVPLAAEAVDLYTALDQLDHATYGEKLAGAQRRLAELQS